MLFQRDPVDDLHCLVELDLKKLVYDDGKQQKDEQEDDAKRQTEIEQASAQIFVLLWRKSHKSQRTKAWSESSFQLQIF